jgi:cytochrome c
VLRRLAALVFLAALAGPAPAAGEGDCFPSSAAQARAMVLKAAAQLEKAGPQAAFRDFQRGDGPYVVRDLYVFVLDFDGNMWVNGAFPQAVGSNALETRDRRGRPYIQEMLAAARRDGEGWILYQWFNPCSGDYMDKNTFFKRVGQFVIAVGTYGSEKR